MKLLYYLCCIGKPKLNIKYNILKHNLNYINKQIGNFDIIINCYDSFNIIYNFIKKYKFLDNIYTHNKEGILTEVWLNNPYNKIINNYDYIIFVLDDVKIININLNDMINIKKKYNIQILSPKVLNSTHKFMNEYNNCITFNNALEVYFLILSPDDFNKFVSINTVENKWMWSVDFLFGYYDIKAAVHMNYEVKHSLKSSMSKENRLLAEKLANSYFKRSIRWLLKNINRVYEIKNL